MFYINNGGSIAGLYHIFDLAEAVIASLTTEATGETFNLADGG
jgi:nucleoside-diphosphate-sugar epimerase